MKCPECPFVLVLANSILPFTSLLPSPCWVFVSPQIWWCCLRSLGPLQSAAGCCQRIWECLYYRLGVIYFVTFACCGSLNVISSHKLIGSSIRRCGFVGVGMALLEEVCHAGGGLWRFLCSEYWLVSWLISCCLQDVRFSVTTSSLCLSAHHHAPHHDDYELNLKV